MWQLVCRCKKNKTSASFKHLWASFLSSLPRHILLEPGNPAIAAGGQWRNWGEVQAFSLARKDAVIEIPTNNTRIHHSHGNITQSNTVHISWARSGDTGCFQPAFKMLFHRTINMVPTATYIYSAAMDGHWGLASYHCVIVLSGF